MAPTAQGVYFAADSPSVLQRGARFVGTVAPGQAGLRLTPCPAVRRREGLFGAAAPGQVDLRLMSPRALCALLAVREAAHDAERAAYHRCTQTLVARWALCLFGV